MLTRCRLLPTWLCLSFLRFVRTCVVPLLCGMLLLFGADCRLSASDLEYSHPGIPIYQICDRPLDVGKGSRLWGLNYTTKQLVTDEDPAELRTFDAADAFFEYNPDAPLSSASKMPREYGLTCVKPSTSYPQWRFLPPSEDLPSSSDLFRRKEPCSAKVAESVGRDARFLGQAPSDKAPCDPPAQAKKPAKKGPPLRVPVCVRPSWVPAPYRDAKGRLVEVVEWGMILEDKTRTWTFEASDYKKGTEKADIIFVFTKDARPESAYYFTKDLTKLSCPTKSTKSFDEVAGTENLPMLAEVTAARETKEAKEAAKKGAADKGAGPSAGPKNGSGQTAGPGRGDGKTTETSARNGKGPPLSFTEVLAQNIMLAGRIAAGDVSGRLDDPNGTRHGMAGGKSVGGPDFVILQAATGVFAIIGIPFKSAKDFIEKVTNALEADKVASIIDPKVLSKELAEQLAKEPDKALVDKVIDVLKTGDKDAVKKAVEALPSFGKAMAPSLRDAGVILPYSRAKIFTAGWEGKFQAHHILEVAMARDTLDMGEKAIDDIPAIILSEAEHKAITKKLNEARASFLQTNGKVADKPQELWQVYKEAYAGYPAWLEAIKGYFPK